MNTFIEKVNMIEKNIYMHNVPFAIRYHTRIMLKKKRSRAYIICVNSKLHIYNLPYD